MEEAMRVNLPCLKLIPNEVAEVTAWAKDEDTARVVLPAQHSGRDVIGYSFSLGLHVGPLNNVNIHLDRVLQGNELPA